MARGWESKSVESQIEASESSGESSDGQRMSPDRIESERKKNGLRLARSRVLQELEACQHARYRDILNQALTDLEAQLAQLG